LVDAGLRPEAEPPVLLDRERRQRLVRGRQARTEPLYTSSIVALDAATGKLKWYFQEVHQDIWDYDAPSPVVLFDAKDSSGRSVPGIAQPGKTGWLYMLNRATGQPLFPTPEEKVPQDVTDNLRGSSDRHLCGDGVCVLRRGRRRLTQTATPDWGSLEPANRQPRSTTLRIARLDGGALGLEAGSLARSFFVSASFGTVRPTCDTHTIPTSRGV
jgi:hypothetical protein